MPQCNPQRLCWACLSHGRESLTPGPWPLGIFPSPVRASGIIQKEVKIRDLLSDSGNIEAFVWWTPAMLWRSGLLVLLAVNKEGLDQIPKWQSRPLVSSPQPTSSAVSPVQSSGLPRRNSKTSRWLAVLRWPLASAQD